MENELYTLSLKLRALAHCLHFAEYVADVTHDCDHQLVMVDLASDYLHYESDRILEGLHCFSDTGYDHSAIFGTAFEDFRRACLGSDSEEVSSDA